MSRNIYATGRRKELYSALQPMIYRYRTPSNVSYLKLLVTRHHKHSGTNNSILFPYVKDTDEMLYRKFAVKQSNYIPLHRAWLHHHRLYMTESK